MNMAKTKAELGESFRIAALTGAPKGPEEYRGDLAESQQDEELILTWNDEQAIFSAPRWHEGSWKLRVALMQAVLATFDCILHAPAGELRWLFSSKITSRPDAADLLTRWIDEGAPPVLDVIDFIVEEHADGRLIRTQGLAAIVGHEIDAIIIDEAHHELAKMVGRLAQETLHSGPLRTPGALGPDGQEYKLDRVADGDRNVPTIRIAEI
jgi:hypothetical protein